MNKTFEAIYMPEGEGLNKGGFKTEDEAWDYVVSRSCEECKSEGISSMCAAEWDVDEEIEFTEVQKESIRLNKKFADSLTHEELDDLMNEYSR